jgi:lysophospholipase L1-like esterase
MMYRRNFLALMGLGLLSNKGCSSNNFNIKNYRNILFFGDSITFQGYFIEEIKAKHPELFLKNAGLSSETVSGLSEEIHNPPRPVLFSRLDREINSFKPDLVVFCYGINDGIYSPFSEQNFDKYKKGVLQFLDRMQAKGIPVVLLTPPPFILKEAKKVEILNSSESTYSWKKPYLKYNNEVIVPFKNYILSLNHPSIVAKVDIFTALSTQSVDAYDENDPIHPNRKGHFYMAEAILKAFGQ